MHPTKTINFLVLGGGKIMVLIMSDCTQLANMYLTNKSTMNNYGKIFKICMRVCVSRTLEMLACEQDFYFGTVL